MRHAMPLALIICLAAAATLVLATLPQLPDPVATHFGSGQRADGWMSRNSYRLYMLSFTLGFPTLMALLIGGLPRAFPRWTNIPHRDYWLAPARRGRTFDFLLNHGCRLGCLMTVMIAGLHYTIVVAHRSTPPTLPLALFLPLLGLFALGFVIWINALYRRFRRPHERYSSGMGLPMA
jgi:uncharacterized membrane protein